MSLSALTLNGREDENLATFGTLELILQIYPFSLIRGQVHASYPAPPPPQKKEAHTLSCFINCTELVLACGPAFLHFQII